MSKEIIKRRKEAKQQLASLFEKKEYGFIIHYSCESFYDRTDGRTPRVNAIVLRNLNSAQTYSFSIHLEAELKNILVAEIQNHYDELEKSMLVKFFEFVKQHQNFNFIHWNMRDGNYGFQAISQRLRVLGDEPIAIVSEDRKQDLSRMLISIYGKNFTGHPRLESLIEKNKIRPLDFLSGEDEARAFENKEFVKLYQSTLRKSDILANIAQLAYEGQLKTNTHWNDSYGCYWSYFKELIREHWIVSFIGLVSSIAGLIALR